MYFQGQPVFSFGHGLSYTQFEYGKLHLSTRQISADGALSARVRIRNVGPRAGSEVVQLYVHQRQETAGRPIPIKKLVGFQKIRLEPGQRATVRFEVSAEQLAIYDEDIHAFVVEPGTYRLLVGSSSDDIRAIKHFSVIQTASSTP